MNHYQLLLGIARAQSSASRMKRLNNRQAYKQTNEMINKKLNDYKSDKIPDSDEITSTHSFLVCLFEFQTSTKTNELNKCIWQVRRAHFLNDIRFMNRNVI